MAWEGKIETAILLLCNAAGRIVPRGPSSDVSAGRLVKKLT